MKKTDFFRVALYAIGAYAAYQGILVGGYFIINLTMEGWGGFRFDGTFTKGIFTDIILLLSYWLVVHLAFKKTEVLVKYISIWEDDEEGQLNISKKELLYVL